MFHGDANINLVIFDAGDTAADTICNNIQLGASDNDQWRLFELFVLDHGFMPNFSNNFTVGYENKTPGLAVAGRRGKTRGLDDGEDIFFVYGS